jgi:hypothetical protein
LPAGTTKDFVVEVHLDHWVHNSNLKRNFTFWWRWTQPDGDEHFKKVGTTRKKAKGHRWDEWMRSPFEGMSVQIVRVACMVKCNRHTSASMKGMVADHNNGPSGWRVADWQKLQVIPADEDNDRGWWGTGPES